MAKTVQYLIKINKNYVCKKRIAYNNEISNKISYNWRPRRLNKLTILNIIGVSSLRLGGIQLTLNHFNTDRIKRIDERARSITGVSILNNDS